VAAQEAGFTQPPTNLVALAVEYFDFGAGGEVAGGN
jgi:hypothetical protein